MQWWLTIASIRLAVICLALWFILRPDLWRRDATSRNREWRWFDYIWSAGSIFSLIHMLAVFSYVHQWSHQLAVEDTARQTDEFLGVAVGIGVYFNYAFVAIWLIDAAWLCLGNESYWRRNIWISRLAYGYLLFISFNGAVVFVSGWFRWFSAALYLAMFLSWLNVRGRESETRGDSNGQDDSN